MKLTSSHIILRSGFTLIELLISMVIFGILSMMILTVYFNASNSSRKLSMTRELSEAAREITERLSEDIKDRGIGEWLEFDPSRVYDPWNVYNYSGNGNETLTIGGPSNKHVYAYGKRSLSGLDPCDEVSARDPKIHCGLYLVVDGEYYNLVDSFIPDESKKRVKIESLKFYTTGDNTTAKKVTINFTLALLPRIGVPTSLIGTTKLHIQTTFSERSWKN